jgi:hypothetical protein
MSDAIQYRCIANTAQLNLSGDFLSQATGRWTRPRPMQSLYDFYSSLSRIIQSQDACGERRAIPDSRNHSALKYSYSTVTDSTP